MSVAVAIQGAVRTRTAARSVALKALKAYKVSKALSDRPEQREQREPQAQRVLTGPPDRKAPRVLLARRVHRLASALLPQPLTGM